MQQYRLIARYWLVTIIGVILVGLMASAYTGFTTSEHMKNSILERAEGLAEMVPAETIEGLQGSEADLNSSQYQALKDRFIRVHEVNHDIRFVYIMGLRDNNEAFFYLDSENPDSEDYSYPGQAYPEGNQDVVTAYNTRHGIVLPIERDRWGSWLSAFAPVINQSNNHVVGILGIDVPASDYYLRVATSAAVPLLLTVLLLMLVLWSRRNARYISQGITQKAFFLSFASHDIRSPLNGISWALQNLEKKNFPAKTTPQTIKRVNQSVSQILATIEDVLALERDEWFRTKRLKKETTNVSEIISDAVAELALAAEEHGITIINEDAGTPVLAKADAVLLGRVIHNLLANAIKYSPANETVTIGTAQEIKQLKISVHNNGPGISEADQARIFEGYYRTKDARTSGKSGTGLGLMLSRDIVQRHGGTLEIESASGQGCTFSVILPK